MDQKAASDRLVDSCGPDIIQARPSALAGAASGDRSVDLADTRIGPPDAASLRPRSETSGTPCKMSGSAGWTTADYLAAVAITAVLIAPAPFFWSPPLWILAFLAAPHAESPLATRQTRSSNRIGICGEADSACEAANDNRPGRLKAGMAQLSAAA